jgi:hypothetical protein
MTSRKNRLFPLSVPKTGQGAETEASLLHPPAARRANKNNTPTRLADIDTGEFWPLLTSTLMMDTQQVSETSVFTLALTRIIARENVI